MASVTQKCPVLGFLAQHHAGKGCHSADVEVKGGQGDRGRIERRTEKQQGMGLSLGLLAVPCLEAPLCTVMRIALCT